MSEYAAKADLGPQSEMDVGCRFYNDTGVYLALWYAYDFITPATIHCLDGEPVPREHGEFNEFISSLKFGSDIVRDGKLVCEKGTKFIKEGGDAVGGDKNEWNMKWLSLGDGELNTLRILHLVDVVSRMRMTTDIYFKAFGIIPHVSKKVMIEAGEARFYSEILPKITREQFLSRVE